MLLALDWSEIVVHQPSLINPSIIDAGLLQPHSELKMGGSLVLRTAHAQPQMG
jgi:hypothetical protein